MTFIKMLRRVWLERDPQLGEDEGNRNSSRITKFNILFDYGKFTSLLPMLTAVLAFVLSSVRLYPQGIFREN